VEWNPPNLFFISRNSEKKMAASQRPLTQQLLAPVPSRLCRANQTEPAGWEILRAEGQMDGVKALVVLASIYYPGDGIVAKNKYQTSSGQRYDQNAPKCAALKWPMGTKLHLVHGRNNIDVTINDHGPYRKGRALDCTPAVDKALHLGGLGSVRVEAYPPLPKARPVEAQALHY
jgi:rare lipoprotein A (peptidoglycan hydrolase)